jgi:hypothetical protein
VHINRKRQFDSQSALDAQSSAQAAEPTRPAERRFSLQRWALACLAVLGTGSLLTLAGCPANLEQPERFDVMVTAGGSTSGGGASTIVPAPPCVTAVFAASCVNACHQPGGGLEEGLDLQSPNVAARLVNVAATHPLSDATMCSPAKLIDPAMPAASWLLAKINGTQGGCGMPMPFGLPAIADDQKACITAWVMSEGSGTAAPAGGAGAAATTAGGAAATVTAGSGGM